MNLNRLKKFISVFIVIVILLSFVIPYSDGYNAIAATVGRIESTEATRPRGFMIEGAEYWDYNENYDKSRIWIDTGEGGGGEGGGTNGDVDSNGGNQGSSNEAGGVFGKSAGTGLGGTGGTAGGSGTSGSALADALRALKSEIEESRAESIARVLESAFNESLTRESIVESERIAESIQKKLMQEQIKNRVLPKETERRIYDAIPNIQTTAPSYDMVRRQETVITMPTAGNIPQVTNTQSNRLGIVFDKAATEVISAVNIMPVAPEEVQNNEPVISGPYVPMPETIKAPETLSTEILEPTASISPSESSTPETEAIPETETEKVEESEDLGEQGGDDPEKDEDLEGEDSENEDAGEAEDAGERYSESEGEHSGKKVFELDVNGEIGLKANSYKIISTRTVILFLSVVLFILGSITFLFSTRDKKSKKNYF